MKAIILTAVVAVAVSSCASKSTEITASYVSPVLYQNLTCQQLAEEARAVSSRAATAAGIQDKAASHDAAMTTVGVVLFWPALFFNKGDGAQSAELARLKGEMQAIEDASRRKGCEMQFKKSPGKTN